MSHEMIGEMPSHRRKLWRMTALYVPLAVGALVLTGISLRSLLDGSGGAVIPLTILLIITGALLFQAVTSLRDLRSQPMFTRGEVQRTWSKGGVLWLFRSHKIEELVVVSSRELRPGDGNGDALCEWKT